MPLACALLVSWAVAVLDSKQRTIVLLRWALILAFAYLMLLAGGLATPPIGLVALVVLALISNLVVARLPQPWTTGRWFDVLLVLFDSTWVTLGLLWAPQSSSELFLLYFFVMFVAAVGESLTVIVGSATLVAVVYGVSSSVRSVDLVSTGALLRVPFLFAVALFYGYFVTRIRGQRNQATESRLRERARIDFLAAASHDLRGPLSNAENLLDLALAPEAANSIDRDLIMRAQVNVQRVNTLVSNLLQAACLEAGEVQLRVAPTEVGSLLHDVGRDAAVAAQLKGVSLSEAIDPRLPLVVADRVQLGRVIANLVDNAIKYTDRGGRVEISAQVTQGKVCLGVSDSGRGMTKDQLAAIFAPYRRVQLDDYVPGTGLGLAIAKQLTEAFGGVIQVTSEPGVGSTFEVILPRCDPGLPAEPLGATTTAPLPVLR